MSSIAEAGIRSVKISPVLVETEEEKRIFALGERNSNAKKALAKTALRKQTPNDEESDLIHALWLRQLEYHGKSVAKSFVYLPVGSLLRKTIGAAHLMIDRSVTINPGTFTLDILCMPPRMLRSFHMLTKQSMQIQITRRENLTMWYTWKTQRCNPRRSCSLSTVTGTIS